MEKNINNNCKIECKKNNKKNKFCFNNIFEVEHFLCSLKQTCKLVDLYKFLK